MAEELDSLLERIQKDGVDKAEARAAEIVAAAEQKAGQIVREAEQKARQAVEQADKDSVAFKQRAEQSLEQAARDVILSVGATVTRLFTKLTRHEVSGALTIETLKQMLTTVVEAYCRTDGGTARIEILLNPEQQQQVVDYLMAKHAESVRNGLEVKADDSVVSGFRVSIVDKELEHDFTDAAIAEALSGLLRPELAEIVRRAAGK